MGIQPNISQAQATADPKPTDPWAELQAELDAYVAAQARLKEDQDEIQKLLAMIAAMKNPLIGAQMLMMDMMQLKGDSVGSLASVDNVDSDLRSILTGAQSNINAQGGKADSDDMNQFMTTLNSLNDFLEGQKGGDLIDSGAISSMQNAISSIKAQFVDANGNSVWGNADQMASAFQGWLNGEQGGTTAPQLGEINSGLQTLNQTTSALSTTTNTNLQYVVQVYQQVEGITNDTMKLYQQLVSSFVHSQRSN